MYCCRTRPRAPRGRCLLRHAGPTYRHRWLPSATSNGQKHPNECLSADTWVDRLRFDPHLEIQLPVRTRPFARMNARGLAMVVVGVAVSQDLRTMSPRYRQLPRRPLGRFAPPCLWQVKLTPVRQASFDPLSDKPGSTSGRRRGESDDEDVVAAAMIGRLVDHAEVASLKGDSYRAKDRDLGRVHNRRRMTNKGSFFQLPLTATPRGGLERRLLRCVRRWASGGMYPLKIWRSRTVICTSGDVQIGSSLRRFEPCDGRCRVIRRGLHGR
jgi:hypothetical protein